MNQKFIILFLFAFVWIMPKLNAQCLNENFNTGSVPSTWTDHGTSQDNIHIGNSNCRALGQGDYLISPPVDNPNQLSFMQDASNSGNGKSVTIQYRVGSSGSWVDLHTFNVNKIHSLITVDLTSINGIDLSYLTSVYFRFPSNFNTWYIDDVKVICGASCTPPTTQVSSLSAGNITDSSVDLSWNRGDGDGGVVVVQRTGAAVNEDPMSGTSYSVGNTIGTGNTVVYVGNGSSCSLTGLNYLTEYYFAVYEYNNTDICYLKPAATISATTLCAVPANNAQSMTFSNVEKKSMTVNWQNGAGENRIVVAKAGSAPDWTPTNNTSYSANPNFGSGTALGNDNFVVYNGSASNVNISNLIEGTEYFFTIFEYNCSGGSETYLVNSGNLTAGQYTELSNVENITTQCITNSGIILNWDLPEGSYEGILITVRAGAVPNQPTCQDGATYTSPNPDLSQALTYCSSSSKYIYNGTGKSVQITGLDAGTNYTFKIFTYQNSQWSSGTQISKTISLLDVTNENIDINNGFLGVAWSNPNNCFDEIMVVGHENGSVTSVPTGDGSLYNANISFGSGSNLGNNDYVIYKGIGTNISVNNLTNGTNYCFKIFVRKGTDWSNGVEVCGMPQNITILNPGDLMILAVHTGYQGQREEFTFVCFKDIIPGTAIDFTDNGYEQCMPNAWGTREGTIRITRQNTTLPAGTSVTVVGVAGGQGGSSVSDFDIYINGVDELVSGGNWTLSFLNSSDGRGFNMNVEDDIWIMQNGSWFENTTGATTSNCNDAHDDTYTGNVLYGWTASGWGTGTYTKKSNLYPTASCFNTDVKYLSNKKRSKVKYTGSFAPATQYEWLERVNKSSNWSGYTSNYSYDNSGKHYRQDGVSITIISGSFNAGTWTGKDGADWFECGNWQNLQVPDENVDVLIGADANGDVMVDLNSTGASKYNFADCRNLTINNNVLFIDGEQSDVINVHGNLQINNDGKLDMSTDSGNGTVNLYGNWDNQAGKANFVAANGSVVLKGHAIQHINNNGFIENFNNLTINNYSDGIILDCDIKINNIFNQKSGNFDLNGKNIEIAGDFELTSGMFKGNELSDFAISGSGNLPDLYFYDNFDLANFSINRAGQTANLQTNLFVKETMNIEAGKVIMNAGKFYDAQTLNNTAGANALILKSNSSGTASLRQGIGNGTGNVEATAERYLTANNWHFYFTPLNNANINILTTTSWNADNPNFYYYDETVADFWKENITYNPLGWQAPNHSGVMQTNGGYIHYSTESKVYPVLGGKLTDADHNFTLSYTDNGSGNEPTTSTNWDEFEGWNFIGNPYACALDWDIIWTNIQANNQDTYLENGIYFYDPTIGKYKFYGTATMNNLGITINGGTKIIPATQGFYIKATPSGHGQSITIPKSARVHDNSQFRGNQNRNEANLLSLNIQKDDYTDETIIRTLENATDDKDLNLDAYKMFGWNGEKPQIYTKNIDFSRTFALNSLAPISNQKSVPVGVYIGYAAEYTINIIDNNFKNVHVSLEDKVKNTFVNFNLPTSYSFMAEQGVCNDRFVLHFSANTPPVLLEQLIDQKIKTSDEWTYTVPEGTFDDYDSNDFITLSAKLADGDSLPSWINFFKDTFKGTTDQAQTFDIMVTATDRFGAEVSDIFRLDVEGELIEMQINKDDAIEIFPSITNGIINVLLAKNTNMKIKIISTDGKVVLKKNIKSNSTQIDLSNFENGIYLVNIYNNQSNITKKIILNK